jgi:hypothetical protein
MPIPEIRMPDSTLTGYFSKSWKSFISVEHAARIGIYPDNYARATAHIFLDEPEPTAQS